MAAGVLDHVSLAYQLFWNKRREVAGVRLHISPHDDSGFETSHLISALLAAWPETAPPLLLASSHAGFLAELLTLMPGTLGQLEISNALLAHTHIAPALAPAQRRGLKLIWRCEPGERLPHDQSATFHQQLISPSAEEALAGLRAESRQRTQTEPTPRHVLQSPLQPGQRYTDIASRALAEHCLDQQQVSSLLGWPNEDVLYDYRSEGIQPDDDTMRRLLRTIDADTSMDEIEQQLGRDPLLSFRYLRFANSAGLGLHHAIESLRQGLMVLGLARTRFWLQEQLVHACDDINLKPVRTSMVLRAQLMAQMLHTGEELALKRELYLCGLLSQIDQLVPDSLAHTLKSIPLPERVKNAILGLGGPYQPYLEMACALEAAQADAARAVCDRHGLDREIINQAVLCTLAQAATKAV